MYADFVPATDATVVSRLKQAGAIILGKTMCTEFAVNDPAPTLHAWHPAHTPGGSSSGSAVEDMALLLHVLAGSDPLLLGLHPPGVSI